jgi:hypothetical protein
MALLVLTIEEEMTDAQFSKWCVDEPFSSEYTMFDNIITGDGTVPWGYDWTNVD